MPTAREKMYDFWRRFELPQQEQRPSLETHWPDRGCMVGHSATTFLRNLKSAPNPVFGKAMEGCPVNQAQSAAADQNPLSESATTRPVTATSCELLRQTRKNNWFRGLETIHSDSSRATIVSFNTNGPILSAAARATRVRPPGPSSAPDGPSPKPCHIRGSRS
jgi:hypothetical protein